MTDLLARWQPSDSEPFDLRRCGHLVRRAAFGASLDLRRELVESGVDEAVDKVLGDRFPGESVDDVHDLIVSMDSFPKLRAYRIWRLLVGKARVRERMSFFWHDRFAVSNRKLSDAPMMTRHFALFDEHGTGKFDDLVLAICRDPAMLRWLDNDTSVQGHPNENLARELFELFTLGRGNYTERDIQEAARAFTGWHVRDGKFKFVGRKHDRGTKEIFGQRGKFGGEDVVALAVERAHSARFVARKLVEFFIGPDATAAEIDAVAKSYTGHDRHVGKTVETLLRSRLFFGERAYRSRIKDPVDLAVGVVRSLGASASPEGIAGAAARMGQSLGEPPNVAGWPGERAWLNSATWVLRSNFAAELGRRYGLDPGFGDAVATVDGAIDTLLDGDLSPASRRALERFAAADDSRGHARRAALVQAVQDLPEAQLL